MLDRLAALPGLTWQPSDQAENLAGISQWVEDSGLPNVMPPLLLDVNMESWPVEQIWMGVDPLLNQAWARREFLKAISS